MTARKDRKRAHEPLCPTFGLSPDEAASEIWRPCPGGLEFYEVSNLGRVRSLDRTLELPGRWGPMQRFHKGRVLRQKPKPNRSGAIYWSVYVGAEGGYRQVNRLVCAAFHGDPPLKKHEAAHLDGDTNNNRAENLEWATPPENAGHKRLHGTNSVGARNGMAKLREDNIRPIFEAYCSGTSSRDLANQFRMSLSNILRILKGRAWGHVDVGDLRRLAAERASENLKMAQLAAAVRMQERGHSLKVQL